MQALDVFMAGDDVEKKKPDPSIYRIAAERLGVQPSECLVVEDSTIGLKVGSILHTSQKPILLTLKEICRMTYDCGHETKMEKGMLWPSLSSRLCEGLPLCT